MRNRYRPHVLVLPEDDANRQIANGFVTFSGIDPGRIQVLPPPGGWTKMLEALQRDQLADLRRFAERMLVLVIEFDGDAGRLGEAISRIPADVQGRVFILGARTEPERLKQALPGCHSYEAIGRALAEDCQANTRKAWVQPDPECNLAELNRMNATVRACLFG